MEIRFFDETTKEASTRYDAVKLIEEYLGQWMQEGDFLSWTWSDMNLPAYGYKPNLAIVMSIECKDVDVWAEIIYDHMIHKRMSYDTKPE